MKKIKELLSGLKGWLSRTFTATVETKKGPKTRLKKGWRVLSIVLACVIGLTAALGAAAAIYVNHLQKQAADLFTSADAADPTPVPTLAAEPTAPPTPDPYAQLQADADLSMMDNIVNILMIGVDYAEEREDWDGKSDFHSDVMIVVAIDFDNNTVDLISLPRDTYAQIPGVEGKYKLNAAINCGGGWPTEGGFQKVCEAAEWMLGGIPVDYYYAVSMPVVKELVDIIGGVEYEIEMDFSMQGRDYTAGLQYMDGQAVLDYCRVRKDIEESGDAHRVNRQKDIMLALFRAAQDRSIITKIPQIIESFEGDLYTNCTYEQTAALALFAYNLSSENVSMYSMGGEMYDIFNWGYVLTDQAQRVSIIEEVYGITVPEYEEYSETYALREWGNMKRDKYLSVTEEIWKELKLSFEADIPLFEAAQAAASTTPAPDAEPLPTPVYTAEQHEKYAKMKEQHDLMTGDGDWYPEGSSMINVCEEYKRYFLELTQMLGYYTDDISWYIYLPIEIEVDFN